MVCYITLCGGDTGVMNRQHGPPHRERMAANTRSQCQSTLPTTHPTIKPNPQMCAVWIAKFQKAAPSMDWPDAALMHAWAALGPNGLTLYIAGEK